MFRSSLVAAVLASAVSSPALAAPQLAPVWSDHVVVQRDVPIHVEGTAAAGERVSGTFGDQSTTARADAQGRFTLEFPAREASSEPLTLAVAGANGDATTVSDVLVGDVWLCSGQSNMEWPLSASVGGAAAAQASADPGLRLMLVPQNTAAAPQAAFSTPTPWRVASPESTPAFSAACYYMARQLRRDLKVPIGAVNSNWGGSQIRAWLSPEAGAGIYGAEQMALLAGFAKDPLKAVTEFAPRWEAWWREGTGGQEPWKNPDGLQWQPVPSISAWPGWTGTRLAEDTVGNVWFRRTLTLTPEQAAKGGTLTIGVIDDLDTTWINGHIVGNTFGWSTERAYPIPPGYLRAGANEIVFAASNSYGPGGFQSSADKLAFAVDGGERIALGEGWRYAIGQLREMPPRAPWDANAGIGVMHNRMIAPLGRFAMEGAAWYQGESDVGIPGYADRLHGLFAGWRRQFGPDMRMLVVQLPNYQTVTEKPVAAGWAEVREQERRAVAADGNAALVPTLDVGQRDDLHPPHKLPVGLRLAAAAQGKPMPMPERAVRHGDAVRVSFTGLEGGLHAWSGAPLGVELCGESQESCRYAAARVEGDALVIRDDGQPATRVRYAWADAPVVNLFDARPLPVPGFELEIAR
ncbi:MAG TPA: sialate O-acetylesterase [Croceibacterium sp.]